MVAEQESTIAALSDELEAMRAQLEEAQARLDEVSDDACPLL